MSEYVTAEQPIRTGFLTQLVLQKYGTDFGADRKYTALTQVRGATGWGEGSDTTADIMILGNWPSSGALLEGFEVKVSRADWLNEVKAGGNKAKTKKYCDRWWLVIADKTMVKDGELFEDWGMMSIENGKLKVIKEAPLLSPLPMPRTFLASLLRHNAKEYIPIDVADDRVKDVKRDIEAEYKKRYAGLLRFVKELHSELGIKLENSHSAGREDDWYARIGSFEIQKLAANGSWNLTPKQLATAIKIVLGRDLSTIKYRLESVAGAAQELLNITKEFTKDEEDK